MVLGTTLGLLAAYGRSAMDNRVSRPEDLRTRGFATLGMIPDTRKITEGDFEGKGVVDVGGVQISTSLVTILTPLSQASEAFRRLRTNVDFSAPDSTKKIVLVTSPEPGEGKTSVSLNLAVANAQLGRKTLFLDADLRRPTSHRLLGGSREPGLVNWLFDYTIRSVSSLGTHIDDLYHLPVGKAAPNPSELLGSQRMKDLIRDLSRDFDTVIIDSPPLLTVTDGLLLGSEVDMVLLVASSGQTHWGALERAREMMDDAGVKCNGVVLNRFDVKQAYGGYGYGYGEEGLYADQEMQRVISQK